MLQKAVTTMFNRDCQYLKAMSFPSKVFGEKWGRREEKFSKGSIIREIAEKLEVSSNVIYYWLKQGCLKARRLKNGLPYWITLDRKDEEKLRQRVLNSYKLQNKKNEHS